MRTVHRSAKRRLARSPTSFRNHVSVASAARSTAVAAMLPSSPSMTASASSFSPRANRASGRAAPTVVTKATTMSSGSAWYPSRSDRHSATRVDGIGTSAEGDDILVLLLFAEARRLEVEHRAVAPAESHELVVRAEL